MSVQEYVDKHSLDPKIGDAVNAAVSAKSPNSVFFISSDMMRVVPSSVIKIKASQIPDGGGTPTIEDDLHTHKGMPRAAAPSGASAKISHKMASTHSLCGILDVNKLTGPNFSDWFRNLKIVLTAEKIAYVLEGDAPELDEHATNDDIAMVNKWHKDATLVRCYMLASMTTDLQRQYENMDARSILMHLKQLFKKQSRTERYEISKSLFGARMSEGTQVQEHVLQMIQWIEKLAELGFIIDRELCIDLILHSLPNSYSFFIMCFYMNKIDVTLVELLNMLKSANVSIKKDKGHALFVGKTNNKKRKGEQFSKKGNEKKNQKKSKKAKKEQHKIEKGKCFQCHQEGHWMRNCKEYLAEKAK